MRTIVIVGSRKYRAYARLVEVLDECVFENNSIEDTIIMSGVCPMKESVDNWALRWAQSRGYYDLPVPPRTNSRGGYFERNKIMAYYADEIIAYRMTKSKSYREE